MHLNLKMKIYTYLHLAHLGKPKQQNLERMRKMRKSHGFQ